MKPECSEALQNYAHYGLQGYEDFKICTLFTVAEAK